MNTRNIAIIVVVIVIIILVIVFSSGSSSTPTDSTGDQNTEDVETTEELFSFEDLDGNLVSSSDFEGQPHIINTWAAWCPFCITEIPDFVELTKETGVPVIAINRKESNAKVEKFLSSVSVSTDDLIFLQDPKDSFYRDIGAISMPETLFVNADGEVVVQKRGFMDLEEMRTHTASITGN